ncbi:MAG: cupin domain-containing protein [Acidobacteriota bacterium]
MVLKKSEIRYEERSEIRGGKGKAKSFCYLKEGDMQNVKFVSLIELEPFSSVGEHPHTEDEEFYFVVEGSGRGFLNGKSFDISEGDAFLCRRNDNHGIEAGKNGLKFLAVLVN